MNISIIADDLTGANDSGVQLVRKGLPVSVSLDADRLDAAEDNVSIVVDTDSRFLKPELAYDAVVRVTRLLREKGQAELVFKKLDSTLRGNIGAEIDAVYDTLHPDFVFIAPAYPKMGRQVRDGKMHVNGILLEHTEVASDPKTPVRTSKIDLIIGEQSRQRCYLITLDKLRQGLPQLTERIRQLSPQATPYIVFDSETDADLERIAALIMSLNHDIVWCGSAGLAEKLPVKRVKDQDKTIGFISPNGQVLFVVGSLSARSRQQLSLLLADSTVAGIQLKPKAIFDSVECKQYLSKLLAQADKLLARGKHIALYSDPSPTALKTVVQEGKKAGLNEVQASDYVSHMLGKLSADLIRRGNIGALVLTGGDTARQVCANLGIYEIRLLRELEFGVPIGSLPGERELYAITKAGSFGSDEVLCKALQQLSGEDEK